MPNELGDLAHTRITTTMIGAIAAIEEVFGHLWGRDKEPRDRTERELAMDDLREEVRARILDLGNDQARAFAEDLQRFDVRRITYQYSFRPAGSPRGDRVPLDILMRNDRGIDREDRGQGR